MIRFSKTFRNAPVYLGIYICNIRTQVTPIMPNNHVIPHTIYPGELISNRMNTQLAA